MIAVCGPSSDKATESEELNAPTKLFQMCQAVVQRYRMYGRPENPGSAHDRSTWYRLVTNSSVKALDNLLSVLKENRQVTFSQIADVCMLTVSKKVLLEYVSVCMCTCSLTKYTTVLVLNIHPPRSSK